MSWGKAGAPSKLPNTPLILGRASRCTIASRWAPTSKPSLQLEGCSLFQSAPTGGSVLILPAISPPCRLPQYRHTAGSYQDGNPEPLLLRDTTGFQTLAPFAFPLFYCLPPLQPLEHSLRRPQRGTFPPFRREVNTERSKSSIWFDNFFRHFVFNGEFLFGKKRQLPLAFCLTTSCARNSPSTTSAVYGFFLRRRHQSQPLPDRLGYSAFIWGRFEPLRVSTNLQEFKR